MKKIVIAILSMTPFLANAYVKADSKYEECLYLGNTAETIMTMRQAGEPIEVIARSLEQIERSTEKELKIYFKVQEMVHEAYEILVFEKKENKDKEIRDFKEKYSTECINKKR